MKHKYTLICMFMWTLAISGCTSSTQQIKNTEIIDIPIDQVQPIASKNKNATNTIIAFFWDVELRYITEDQLDEILKALQDMSTKPVDELKEIRYADFNGNPNEWTLLQLVHAYFVPAQEVDLAHFYRDLAAPEARTMIRETRDEVNTYRQEGKQTFDNPKPITGW